MSQKSDASHTNSSMYFFLLFSLSFLVSHEALIERAIKRAYQRTWKTMSYLHKNIIPLLLSTWAVYTYMSGAYPEIVKTSGAQCRPPWLADEEILGFRWSKKAKITLENLSFWQNISISTFKVSPIIYIQWKLANEILSIFKDLQTPW